MLKAQAALERAVGEFEDIDDWNVESGRDLTRKWKEPRSTTLELLPCSSRGSTLRGESQHAQARLWSSLRAKASLEVSLLTDHTTKLLVRFASTVKTIKVQAKAARAVDKD